jgi:hypothetical protein
MTLRTKDIRAISAKFSRKESETQNKPSFDITPRPDICK